MKKGNLSVVDRKISAEIKIKFQIRYLYLHLTIGSSFDSLQVCLDSKIKLEGVGTWNM